MQRWVGKVAVVTGASAGIGAAIAKDLTKAGMTVVALARREDRLEELKTELSDAPGKLHPMKMDVTKPKEVKQTFKNIERNFGCVNVLINNAGILRKTTLLTENNDDILMEVLNTNFVGMIQCIKESYYLMNKYNADGHIVNINSIFGHSIPFLCTNKSMHNLYPSTKHAMRAATEVIRQELILNKNKKIKISNVSPGLVLTEIAIAAGEPTNPILKGIYITSEDVSNSVMFILSQPPNVQILDIIVKPVGELL